MTFFTPPIGEALSPAKVVLYKMAMSQTSKKEFKFGIPQIFIFCLYWINADGIAFDGKTLPSSCSSFCRSSTSSINDIDVAGFKLSLLDKALLIRGAGSVETDEDDEDVDDDDLDKLESDSLVMNHILKLSKKSFTMAQKASSATSKAVTRALNNSLEKESKKSKHKDDEDNDDQIGSVVARIVGSAMRFWSALLQSTSRSGADDNGKERKEATRSKRKRQEPTISEVASSSSGLREYLAKTYDVEPIESSDEDEATDKVSISIMGGSLSEALRKARSEARLLVLLIPSALHRPSKGASSQLSADQKAIQSLLSSEVADVANKRARKKVDSGSFVLWAAKAGSPEAKAAIKRVKAKTSKGKEKPILMVVYPTQAVDSSGIPKIAPKVFAQHHCNPPPTASAMAAWLRALRKRHLKQYAVMQLEQQEIQFSKERRQGYKSSVSDDTNRKEMEQKNREEQAVKEKAEQERQRMVEERREELKQSLPEKPPTTDKTSVNVALRFTDGRSGKRRFDPETKLRVLFDWVDAMYEIERESVVLTTMNGKKTFSWDEDDESTIGDANLGRMIGLRVSQKTAEEDKDDEKSVDKGEEDKEETS